MPRKKGAAPEMEATQETPVTPQNTSEPKTSKAPSAGAAKCQKELEAARAELAEAQRKTKYLDQLPTPVIAIDTEFTITYANRKAARVLGKSPAETVGQKCYELLKTYHCQTNECRCAQAMKQDGVFTADTEASLPSGSLSIRYTGTPLKDSEGNVIGALEYITDISKETQIADSLQELMEAAAAGQLTARADTTKFDGNYQTIVRSINSLIEIFVGALNGAIEHIDKIARGEIPARITADYNGDFNKIRDGLNGCIDAVGALVTDARTLVAAATEGRLEVRADAAKHKGDYKKVIQGFNDTLDAVIGPLTGAAECIASIAKGDIPEKTTQEFKGTFNDLKNNLNALIDSLNAVTDIAIQIAEGNLTVKVQPRSDEDHLLKAFAKMAGNLTNVVGKVKQSADALTQASEQLALAAKQAGEATQQVASTSQEMARGAGDQAATAQQSAQIMQQLAQIIEQVAQGSRDQAEGVGKATTAIGEISTSMEAMAKNAGAASNGSKTAADAAGKGAEKAKQTVEGMERITATVDDASSKVTKLGTQSEEIGKIVAVIDDIAAQTNLLALNAAIEAARAGEHGRGFAVVSDEVRKLAERTASATKEIADLIRNIQKGVAEAVRAMQEGAQEVKDGYKLASQAGDALEDILKATAAVSDQIEQISAGAEQISASTNELVSVIDNVGSITEMNTAATQQMASTSEEVGKSIESVAGVAEENSAATEEVSASAEEMGAQVEEIIVSSQSLKEMAKGLQEAITAFKMQQNKRTLQEALV
ncbi:MAG: PAS domain-containing protein [Chloroflexi bacterium]|nr:PAS domain-containing protein [Chloroflexota bacterium]